MTQNKSLKRRVRERMSKTGERYTAARKQVLAKRVEQAPAAPDEPLHGPTDRSLPAWFALLDEWGARELPHRDIATALSREGVPPWWTQDITVRYERHVGRRVVGQRVDLSFSATGSKTIAVPPAVARAAWTDESIRARWLPDVRLRQRPNRAPVAARFDVQDGDGRVVVSFDAKGHDKVVVSVEHEKLPDKATTERWSKLWRQRLVALKQLLETG